MKTKIIPILIMIGGSSITFGNENLPPLSVGGQANLQENIKYCNWCHGSPSGITPSLDGQTVDYLNIQIQNFVSEKRDNPNAREIMWNAVSNLDPEILPYLVDYYSNLNARPSSNLNKAMIQKGLQIYQNGLPAKNIMACTLCHGPVGAGNSVFPRLAGQNKYYIINQFRDWKSGYRAYTAPMPQYAKSLDDDEINALAEYLTSL